MDEKNLTGEVLKAYQDSPKEIQAYISNEFFDFVEFVRERLSLTPTQSDIASSEILYALLSISDMKELKENLVAAGLSEDIAIPIVGMVSEGIFEPLLEQNKEKPRAAAPVPPPAPLNRLAGTPAPKLLPKPVTPPATPVAAPAPKPLVPAPTIVAKPAPVEVPKPVVPTPTPTPIVPPSAVVAPKPPSPQPIVAPVPPAEDKKHPEAQAVPTPPVPKPAIPVDPYREPLE